MALAMSNERDKPQDWGRAASAVSAFQNLLASHVPPLQLLLARDKVTGHSDGELLGRCGVYIHFYSSGLAARVGKAINTFQTRLADYELDRKGWFESRWVAVVPFEPQFKCLVPALEAELIEKLDPPENEHHRRR